MDLGEALDGYCDYTGKGKTEWCFVYRGRRVIRGDFTISEYLGTLTEQLLGDIPLDLGIAGGDTMDAKSERIAQAGVLVWALTWTADSRRRSANVQLGDGRPETANGGHRSNTTGSLVFQACSST